MDIKTTNVMIYSYFCPLPCWGTFLNVVSSPNLKSVTLFLVTGWEGYLASPESLFHSEIVEAEAWKQIFLLLWMINTRKCSSQLMSTVYNQRNL